MADVKATRMELLNTKKKLKLANKGHKLLKQKTDVLVLEFFNTLREIKKLRIEIGTKLYQAEEALIRAQSIEGEANIDSIIDSSCKEFDVEFENRTLMGVRFPEIKSIRSSSEHFGYHGQSLELDQATALYRKLLPHLLELAKKQLMLKKLGEEIKKTKRRVNSLEFLMIPNIKKTKKIISLKLEELERESFTRLKNIKKKQQS
ncbi:V-type ATP synthase subunit D [Candidatus Woesearchaeota archaeon]|nr:V-type ATP synthase subunit D [Candidatus Woesearchaeota archaeon]